MLDSTENRDQNDYNQGWNFNKTSLLKNSILKSADCYDKSLDSDNDSERRKERDRREKKWNWEGREGEGKGESEGGEKKEKEKIGERREGWMNRKKRN